MSQRKHRAQRSTSSLPATGMLLSPRHLVLEGVALIVVATFMAYQPALRGEFILDDDALLTKNPLIKAPDGLVRLWCSTEPQDYWPMTNTSFWLEWRLWGMHPTGYHITNLLFHITAALLVWAILRKLAIPGAFLAALLFAVHPVNVESVAWIAQRKNTLAMLFFLLSILCYLRQTQPPRTTDHEQRADHWYWLSLLAFVLAMLSKGSVALLPVVLLLITWWQRRRIELRDLVRTVPFFLAAIVLTAVNIWFQKHGLDVVVRKVDFAQRLAGAGAVVWFYLAKGLAPIHLVFVYPQWQIESGAFAWWLPLVAAIVVTLLLAGRLTSTANWDRALLFAWLFFCVALVPVLGFTDVGFMRYALVADHYEHIAIIGISALVAAGWSVWHARAPGANRSAATVSAIVAVSLLILLTWHQSRLYGDARTLYQATLAENPDCWMAHNNLGAVLVNAGRLPEAIEHYRQALRLKPNYAEAQNNLGVALIKIGQPQQAIEYLEQALHLQPDYLDAYNNLGLALFNAGRNQQAIENFREALRLQPDYVLAHNNLGNALLKNGQFQQALEEFQEALRLDPAYAEAHSNLGNALSQLNRPQEAIDQYQQALRLNPNSAVIHNNLGLILASIGQLPEAIQQHQQSLRLQSDYVEAYNNLGSALLRSARPAEAIEQYKQAIRLKHDYLEAHCNLGLALLNAGHLQEAVEQCQQALQLDPDNANANANLAMTYGQMHRSEEAIAVAQKALKLARSQNDTALAQKIDDWLKKYRDSQSIQPEKAVSPNATSPRP